MKLLLQVENCFLLAHQGLLIAPDLNVPDPTIPLPLCTQIKLRTPTGHVQNDDARFELSHIHSTKIASSKRFFLSLILPKGIPESVPITSNVYVSEEVSSQLGHSVRASAKDPDV